MANQNNRPTLRIVGENDTASDHIELLVAAPGGKRVRIAEGDVTRPHLDISLVDYAIGIRPDPEACGAISAILPLRWKGFTRGVFGDLIPLLDGSDVIVPRGTIARWMAEAA